MVEAETSWSAAQTIHRLFQHLDDGRMEQVAALFAADGVWHRQGKQLTGPDEILQALRARPDHLATRHLVTNMVLEAKEGGFSARYYVTVFADEAAPVSGPAQLGPPESIMILNDQLVATNRGWRFLRRQPQVVFKKS